MTNSSSRFRPLAALVAVMMLGSGASAAVAQETSALRGEMFMAGKTPIDPPKEEQKNTHAYVTVTGPAALRMYRSMRAREEENLCETGKKMKRAGTLICSIAADRKSASCDFSVDLIKGTLDDGRAC